MNNFEEKLRRLEELSEAIKGSDITLEEALKDFEEGIKLAKGMEKELDAIEGKIQILMNAPAEDSESAEEEKSGEEKKKRASKTKKPKDESDVPVLDLFSPSTEVNGTRNG
ncbi:MAG: exodeoxyribonuclease VII small subunit [Treponema sp.]|nr:exodeoxyribonuclease VII small subunit [Treponema sp.]